MDLNLTKRAALILLCVAASFAAQAAKITGSVVDKTSKEPLIGATVLVEGTANGAIVTFDGSFELEVKGGVQNLVVSYVSYKDYKFQVDGSKAQSVAIEMETDAIQVTQVQVTARKNLESEVALQKERATSTVAIENIGAKEMSVKGLSNVEEGVKKMTGISVASAGQLVVRGLGDRYSSTTLNGQPIASPNPDNKLIQLDVFPSSTVKNVTVSKVYNATEYADYAGAHIDISTKDQGASDFFQVSFSVGADLNSVGRDFYRMDNVSLFTQSKADDFIFNTSKPSEAKSYIKENKDVFDTDFSSSATTALPNFSGGIGWGHTYDVGAQKLSVLASGSMSSDNTTELNSISKAIQADGKYSDDYTYDSYTSELKMAGLVSLNTTLREADRVGYTFFYARNASDEFQNRRGVDYDLNKTIANVDVVHIYKMMTHQIHGTHQFGSKWNLDWNGAYTTSSSDEPDRRQVMFGYDDDGSVSLFTDKENTVMRYFGYLKEDEINGNIATTYKFGKAHKAIFGGSYKTKERDVNSTRFYYDVKSIDVPAMVSDLYNTNSYLNYDNISSGAISVTRDMQDKDQYNATHEIAAGYASVDLSFADRWLVNLGLRYEHSTQVVNYDNKTKTRELASSDFFPAVNAKYSLNKESQIRFAASKTVTRPQFIEMAPFEYKQSYGSATVSGNENLQNGYNYNIDLRYESFFQRGEMFSVTAYYKILDDPIERIQYAQGGGTINSFQNAEAGLAAGAEFEFRKVLYKELVLGANLSYMYTNVSLSEDGGYTNADRSLQGASPYLVNADITYTPTFGEDKQLSLALLYNLQGPRISTVGVRDCQDVIQRAYHKLNFAASYSINKLVSLKLQVDNLLYQAQVYEQEVPSINQVVEVERHQVGVGASVGVSLNF